MSLYAHLTDEPGIYRMLDQDGTVLYVGKASHLKKRVSSYFNRHHPSAKTRSLVKQIATIEVTITRTEAEALLLESSLIKSLHPKYNVLLRDDKTYPYIHVTSSHPYPRMELYRSKKKPSGRDFFGPYTSINAVKETLNTIQKVFKIRNCRDSYFSARTRPCLQYEIKRCTAPCTDYISKSAYNDSVQQAIQFLQGKSQQIIADIEMRMEQAVARLAFEEAAVYRDQIKSLRVVQERQGVVQLQGDADVIVLEARPGFACIQWVSVRDGQVIASQHFFPEVPSIVLDEEDGDAEHACIRQQVLEAFIAYFYLDMPARIPALILFDKAPRDYQTLAECLSELRGKKCRVQINPRAGKGRWIDFALNNLHLAIEAQQASKAVIRARYQALMDLLGITTTITRMECFDISHTLGEATIASCVVFDENGPCNAQYRRFNIRDIQAGDDYAAMQQALQRHFKRVQAGEQRPPDILVIDGGKGQVNIAKKVLHELQVDGIEIVGVAKGPERKAGLEQLILATQEREITLPSDSPALHLLQHIRDEAHRFAITAHRKKRQKTRFESSLDLIEGVGPKRRQALLRRFGGIQALTKASVEEIVKVSGISQALAERIYLYFHPG